VTYNLIYPEHRPISASELLLMGQQAYADGDLLVKPETGAEAADMLSTEGLITLTRRSPVPVRR
jgi:hypothetical protein